MSHWRSRVMRVKVSWQVTWPALLLLRHRMLTRPAADEYFEYYGRYIALVPDGDVRDHLRTQLSETIALLSAVPDAKAERAYGAGKWTLKEVVLHMADTERVFGYRTLRIARGDTTPLPGFEQDEWVPHSCANTRRSE